MFIPSHFFWREMEEYMFRVFFTKQKNTKNKDYFGSWKFLGRLTTTTTTTTTRRTTRTTSSSTSSTTTSSSASHHHHPPPPATTTTTTTTTTTKANINIQIGRLQPQPTTKGWPWCPRFYFFSGRSKVQPTRTLLSSWPSPTARDSVSPQSAARCWGANT